MKTINFYSGKLLGERRPSFTRLDVNAETLSPLARWIADHIHTTENADDLSVIHCYSSETQRDWYTKRGEIDHAIEHFDGEWLDRPLECVWRWDRLKRGETGEAYFERHAAAMIAAGVHSVKDHRFENEFII